MPSKASPKPAKKNLRKQPSGGSSKTQVGSRRSALRPKPKKGIKQAG